MKTYLISYDLNKPGQDYDPLYAAIKALSSGWWHCLDSTWVIKHSGPAAAIRDALASYLDASDDLLVVHLSGEGAWRGFVDKCSSWLVDSLGNS